MTLEAAAQKLANGRAMYHSYIKCIGVTHDSIVVFVTTKAKIAKAANDLGKTWENYPLTFAVFGSAANPALLNVFDVGESQ